MPRAYADPARADAERSFVLDGARGFSCLAGSALHRAGETDRGDHEGAEQSDPVSPVDAEADLGRARARLVDHAVVEDQHRPGEPGDHRHLPWRVGKLVTADE